MLVVKVEVWPSGDNKRGKEISRLYVGNVSDLADISSYIYRFDNELWKSGITHARKDGAWELIRKVLEKKKS